MKCEQIQELLSAYIDDMLDADSGKEVEAHLGSCVSCAREEKVLRNLVRELNSLEKAKAPEDFLPQVRQRIQRRSEFERMMRSVFPARVTTQLKLTGVLVTVILGIAVYKILEPGIGFQPGFRQIPFPPPVSAPAQVSKLAEVESVSVQMKKEDVGRIVSGEEQEKDKIDSLDGTVFSAPQELQTSPRAFQAKGTLSADQGNRAITDALESSSVGEAPLPEENFDIDLPLLLLEAGTFPQVRDRMDVLVAELQGNMLVSDIDKESGDYLFIVQIPALQIPVFEERLYEFCLMDTPFPAVNANDTLLTIRLRLRAQ